MLSDAIGEYGCPLTPEAYSVLMGFNPTRVSDGSCLGDGMARLGRAIAPRPMGRDSGGGVSTRAWPSSEELEDG